MNWRNELASMLSGRKYGIPRDRLEWRGYMDVFSTYKNASAEDREAIELAMTEILSDSSDPDTIAADVKQLIKDLGIVRTGLRD